ncbi:MAG: sulfotransferase family 2 domain-containing protein [Planctomycetota bacterium]
MTVPPQRRGSPLGPDDQFYFLHIPKTAGTTLRKFLQDRFHKRAVSPHQMLPDLIAHPPSELGSYRLFCGHHGMYVRRVLGRDPVTITVLRDPIARSVSHFRDVKTRKDTWLYDRVQPMSFEEFVMSDLGVTELLNLQARYLSYENIAEDYFGHSALVRRSLDEAEAKYRRRELLDIGRRRLDEIAYVGIQEQFEASLLLLSHTFAWTPPVGDAVSFNRSKLSFDESELTPAALERVRDLTQIDQGLYEHGKALFEDRIGGVTPESAEQRYRDGMRAVARKTTVSLGFEQPIAGTNWMPREISNNRVVRWTGPATTTHLDLPLAIDKPLRLRCRLCALDTRVLGSLRLTANGHAVELRSWPMCDPPRPDMTFDGVLTPDMLRENDAYCRLAFEVDDVIRPTDIDPDSTDERLLGLHFAWLEIMPA